MRFFVLAALLLLTLPQTAWAGFTYLGSLNGVNLLDTDDYFKFYQPTGLLYVDGNLYVADGGRNAFYKIAVNETLNQSIRKTVLLSSASSSPFDNPLRMAYENGTFYVADGISTVVKTWSGEGFQTRDWNSKQGSNMEKPSGVALDSQTAYITDIAKGRLYLYLRSNKMYLKIGIEQGNSDGKLQAPADVEIYGDRVFVSDSGKGLIFAYDRNLTFLYTIGRGLGGVSLTSPRGFAIYEDRIYVADSSTSSVVVFTLDGYPIDVIDSSVADANLSRPEDVAIGEGKLFVADTGSRLVKVFELNRTVGNDSVKALIAGANRSLAQLYALAPVAQKLGLEFSEGNARYDLASAMSSYDNFMFAEAALLGQKTIDETVALQLNLSQAIELKIKQMAAEQSGRVEPYRRQGLSGSAAGKIVQFDNMVADINAKLAGRGYGLAADSALLLPAVADDYIRLVNESEKKEEERKQSKTISGFDLQISALQLRLNRLKSSAATYRQALNLSGAEELVSSASASAAEGDFDSSNRSIGLADFEISAQEALVAQAAGEIDLAMGNLSVIEFDFNSSAAKPMLFPPDLAPEQSQMQQARETVYTNPQLAVAMAQKALSSALLKAKSANAVSTAAAAVLVMLALIGVIALAFSFHIYSRRRKMREAKQKKDEPTHIIWKE